MSAEARETGLFGLIRCISAAHAAIRDEPDPGAQPESSRAMPKTFEKKRSPAHPKGTLDGAFKTRPNGVVAVRVWQSAFFSVYGGGMGVYMDTGRADCIQVGRSGK